MPPARGGSGAARRAATRPRPGATLAGGRYLLVALAPRPAPPARVRGSKSCARRPPRPPAPTYLFGIRRPASGSGLPNEPQDGALVPGRTVPGAGQHSIVPVRRAIIRRRPKSERGYPSGQRSPFTAIP